MRMLFGVNDLKDFGFWLSEELLEQGYTPNYRLLLVSYMLLASAIMLYLAFGVTFLNKSRDPDEIGMSEGQKSYNRGLGLFIIAVALSQVLTIIDLMSFDIEGVGFFRTADMYGFDSMIGGDDYIVGFTMVLFALWFLVYPLEKYLLDKRPVLAGFIGMMIFAPGLLRSIEINRSMFGFELIQGEFHYHFMTALWIIVILVIIISVLFVLKLYINLGVKSPPKSKLRKRSRYIVIGIAIWIACIFIASPVHLQVSTVTSPYGFQAPDPSPGTLPFFVHQLGLYWLFPVFIPLLLFIALTFLINGFKRDF